MQVSPNFALSEFARSAMAARMGRTFTVPGDLIPNIVRLCMTVLEPLRAAEPLPIFVLSGYRPGWLNRAVGGAAQSDHLTASAADIVIKGAPPREIAALVRSLDLPVKQCILEFGQWVHLSVPPEGVEPQRDYLTARKLSGRTIYTRGLA